MGDTEGSDRREVWVAKLGNLYLELKAVLKAVLGLVKGECVYLTEQEGPDHPGCKVSILSLLLTTLATSLLLGTELSFWEGSLSEVLPFPETLPNPEWHVGGLRQSLHEAYSWRSRWGQMQMLH